MDNGTFETTIAAFEKRMAQRRKMLSVTGVKLPKRLSKIVEDEIRDSIIHCHECKTGESCADWLATAVNGTAPPEFCPNYDTILRLKAMGLSKE